MSLKATSSGLVEKTNAIKKKISQADFDLMNIVQENDTLRSKIVQSPDKLQKSRDEKISQKNAVVNSERLAVQNVQQINTTLEVHAKASEKLCKLIGQIQEIQEQVNKAKGCDKDIKTFRAKLSEEAKLTISLDTKTDELQGKVKQTEDSMKAMVKGSNARRENDSQQLESLRKEVEGKLHCLEPRDKATEAMAVKAISLGTNADSVKEAGKFKQQKLLAKMEEIVDVFETYCNSFESTLSLLRPPEATVEK